MANFVLIENNIIIEKHDLLPKNWKHISGLHLAENDEEFLNSLGWYTVNKIYPTYNEFTQYVDGYDYEFENNIVSEIPIIKDVEINDQLVAESSHLTFVRMRRDELLAKSDWTQTLDIQNMQTDKWKHDWLTYRQSLRDIPNRCISGELNMYTFDWPYSPNDSNFISTYVESNNI
jgi:hypothetical protein